MNKSPLVSIIMNCYNGEKYLREAIDSVYAQTYTRWEIIFWDDASTDRSAKIAQSYDERIKYYYSKKASSLGEARVLAVEKASGEFLAFLDCDDVWFQKKLELQIKIFSDRQNLGLVYGRAEVIYQSSSKKPFTPRAKQLLPEGSVFGRLAQENFIVFSSAVVDRNLFYKCGGFPINFKHSPDYWSFLRLARHCQVGVLQSICCQVRWHDNNMSIALEKTSKEESIEALYPLLPDKEAIEGLRYHYVSLAVWHIKEKNFLAALKILIKERGWIILFKRFVDRISGNI
jgi:glycosyltransferase involved in cell wall biosynthesis